MESTIAKGTKYVLPMRRAKGEDRAVIRELEGVEVGESYQNCVVDVVRSLASRA